MTDEKNNCITDSLFQKKLEKIKAFKRKIVSIKPEEVNGESMPKLFTGEKAKEKMDSIYLPNSVENSAKKHRLKLITRNELFIYLDEPKKQKSKMLQPIEESKNEYSAGIRKITKLNNIKTNKTVQIKAIKLISKEKKLSNNASQRNINENKKEEEKEKSKEKEKTENKEEKKEENKEEKKEKVEDLNKSKELNPIILKGKKLSLKASQNISSLKNIIKEDEKNNSNSNEINSKNLSTVKDTSKPKSTTKREFKLQYCVYPGNNSALIDKVMAHRLDEWEKVPTTFSEFCDLVWAPLTGSINFQNCERRHQYANHIEFNIEISNKMRLYANLLKHCEEKKIDTFSIFPFTISLQLSHWSFNEQLSNFKKLYNNIDKYTPNGNRKFAEMFNVILSRKIGSMQYINIPKTFNSGKNMWIIKPINLNRGRYITVENNVKDIIQKLEIIQERKKINVLEKKKGYEIKCEYILIQKYLEKPLLYQERKFDI